MPVRSERGMAALMNDVVDAPKTCPDKEYEKNHAEECRTRSLIQQHVSNSDSHHDLRHIRGEYSQRIKSGSLRQKLEVPKIRCSNLCR